MSCKPALLAVACLLALPSYAAATPLVPGTNPALDQWLRVVYARLVASATRSHGFPRSARVKVELVVRHDGSVAEVRTIASSDPDVRYADLGARVVGLAQPFPPMPDSVEIERTKLVVPLRFDVPLRRRHRARDHG